jgi:hypothetical protein
MRLAPGPWLPFRAEEWFEGGDIDFRWRAWVTMSPFMSARVVDAFQRGRGALTAWAFGLVPVMWSRGRAANKGEAVRGLTELPWRPFAFRETPRLTWEATAPNKLRGTFNDGNTQATVEFDVDTEGHVLGATAIRPRPVGTSTVDTAWSGVFREYRIFNRVRVPTFAEVSWRLPDGPFTYWRGRIAEFRVLR